jgi:hypothetical protein
MTQGAGKDGPLYYVEGGMVWQRPITTHREDGSATVSMGFPACIMHEIIGDEQAPKVAALMNKGELHDDLLKALKAIVDAWDKSPSGEMHLAEAVSDPIEAARVAITKAEELDAENESSE